MGDLPDLANLAGPGIPALEEARNLDYLDRVNRAIDHVVRNLDAPLQLEDVAKVACFSPFHFHRIFRATTGETLHDFVKRTRLERALHQIAHSRPASLTEVALACGFSSSSDFSRSFKAHFGTSPSQFDPAELQARHRQSLLDTLPASQRLRALPAAGENPDRFEVVMRDLPARRIAYRRVMRPYGGSKAERARERSRPSSPGTGEVEPTQKYGGPGPVETAAQLVEWAKARGLERGQWLGYQWDDPEIVPIQRCRYDVGVEVPEGIELGSDVTETRFEPMRVAELTIKGDISLELRALLWLYHPWLPHSGFVPDHQPCFEAWNGLPFAHGTEHFEVRVQLAVLPARR